MEVDCTSLCVFKSHDKRRVGKYNPFLAARCETVNELHMHFRSVSWSQQKPSIKRHVSAKKDKPNCPVIEVCFSVKLHSALILKYKCLIKKFRDSQKFFVKGNDSMFARMWTNLDLLITESLYGFTE